MSIPLSGTLWLWLACASLVHAGEIETSGLRLAAEQNGPRLLLQLSDAQGLEYAAGEPLYVIEQPRGHETLVSPLKVTELQHPASGGVLIIAHGAGLEVRHQFQARATRDGLEERIEVLNTSSEVIEISDYRFMLRRPSTAAGQIRAVAVPFRRQADGKLRDWTCAEIAAGKASNSDWRNDPAVKPDELIDSTRGRLRSEAWVLTDGKSGLLVAKYNQEDIEYAMLGPDEHQPGGLLLGGSSFALHREPESMQRLQPGQRVRLGTTYYLHLEGGWPEGYRRYKQLLEELGHGLTADYDPPVNWNELFDIGWYHSDPAALARHYTRQALLGEAAKAAEVGATALYLDPGWEVCEGTALWAEDRLGKPEDLVRTLREEHGLDLAFRTIGRVYRDEFPDEWYVQHPQRAPGQAYQRPSLTESPRPQPVPPTDERGHRNLALLPEARATASSCLPGYAIHSIEHLNDGWYGNAASWISNGEPSWVEIDLGDTYSVDRVRLGSENAPWHRDRSPTSLRIAASADDSDRASWQLLAEVTNQPIQSTRSFGFDARPIRRIRIDILASTAGEARIDEVEILESHPQAWAVQPRLRDLGPPSTQPVANPIAFWEVCSQCPQWQAEKLNRIERIAKAGMRFIMFDEFDWRGPCHAEHHGHAVPSTPEGHVRAVYGLVREIKRRVPGVLVEAHDPVWPWGVRYLPIYFDQTLDPARRPGSYDENWGFEFMWNPIEDLISGRALCLYYYNLACDIPLYDHITAENDNDDCLAFWWYASTIRHLGIGGKKGLGSKEPNQARWQAYRQAMQLYLQLRPWFVRGRFVGIDELAHLHVLNDRPGGVVVAFNLADQPLVRELVLDLGVLRLDAVPAELPEARVETRDGKMVISLTIPPRSPRVIQIGVE